jgi:hemerythrin-like domain-containing protein
MPHPAVELIREEHAALASVLHALRDTVDRSRTSDVPPNFERLRAMLFYMDEMPVRLHHAVEEQLLFPRIRERCPPLRPVLDRLEAEHSRGEGTVQSLERALTAWQVMGDDRREAFELLLRGYVDGYLGHMEVEENYVLAVAHDYLSEADWLDLHAAFVRQRGSLAAATTAAGHRALLQRILHNKPSAPQQPSSCGG